MLREQVAVQPRFDCPSCHQPVQVTLGPQGQVTAECGEYSPAPAELSGEHSKATEKAGIPSRSHPEKPADVSPLQEVLRQAPIQQTDVRSATGRMAGLVQKARRPSSARSDSTASSGLPWYLSPTLIAWSVAGICSTALLGFALKYDSWPGHASSANQPQPAEVANANSEKQANVGEATGAQSQTSPPPEGKAPLVKPPLGNNTRERLTGLGVALKRQQELEGLYPAGTWPLPGVPVEQRFSWLARVVHLQGWQPVVPVVWDRPWNDPINDSFVRRRIPELQNPAVAQLTGSDRYPATHYVGVAGVGADAARLTLDDPRAGVFGDDRRTKIADFKGGLSHTMLIAGVQEQLGSWSSGGTATVRGFSQQPYVNGPDGFGTGQARSMLVLMADGSVREISADTAPQVVRHLATLADDAKLPVPTPVPPVPVAAKPPAEVEAPLPPAGAPGVPPPPAPGQNPADAMDPAGRGRKPNIIAEPVGGAPNKPPAPVAGAKVPAKQLDPQTSLQVKIAKYKRTESVPLATVLDELAEMSGVDIVCEPGVLGPLGMLQLNEKVSVNLEGSSIRGILTAVLQQVQLSFKVERGQGHIIPAAASR